MWSQIGRRSSETIRAKSSNPIAWVKQSVGDARRVPKFGVDAAGAGAGGILPVNSNARVKVADGNRHGRDSMLLTMAAKKRIPLIKFPNRRAGETQGSKAVGRASGGGGRSPAMPSLPSGTASNHPPRTTLSQAEIEAVLLGAIFEEPAPKKAAAKKK